MDAVGLEMEKKDFRSLEMFMKVTRDKPEVSFVLVNWNTREYSLKCIRSLYKYLHGLRFEIIFVDNGSDDGSVEAVSAEFPDVRIVQLEENLGFARGVNLGIREGVGEFFCLVNSDVELIDDSVVKFFEDFRKNERIGIAGPKLFYEDMKMQWSCKRFPSLWIELCRSVGLTKLFPRSDCFPSDHMTQFDHDSLREVDSLVGAFLLIRREVFEDIGLLDESFFMYGEETDFCLRAKRAGWKIIFDPGGRVIHFGGVSSGRAPDKFFKEYHRSSIRFWKKNYGFARYKAFLVINIVKMALRIARQGLTGGTDEEGGGRNGRYRDTLLLYTRAFLGKQPFHETGKIPCDLGGK